MCNNIKFLILDCFVIKDTFFWCFFFCILKSFLYSLVLNYHFTISPILSSISVSPFSLFDRTFVSPLIFPLLCLIRAVFYSLNVPTVFKNFDTGVTLSLFPKVSYSPRLYIFCPLPLIVYTLTSVTNNFSLFTSSCL